MVEAFDLSVVRGRRGLLGNLEQRRDHGQLRPVLGVQIGELALCLDGLLERRIVEQRPATDDLLGLGVGPVDTGGLASAYDEVHCVLGAIEAAAVEEVRSEEHTSELQSLMRSSYAVFCLKKKTK